MCVGCEPGVCEVGADVVLDAGVCVATGVCVGFGVGCAGWMKPVITF
jgi:hypothetical protein